MIIGCKNTIIPSSVQKIGLASFYFCRDLESIFIPREICLLHNIAFNNCPNLKSIKVDPDSYYYESPENSNAIIKSDELILGCYTTIIPNEVTKITRNAFYGAEKLTEIKIPDGVTLIDAYAFGECTSLSHITIPQNVNIVGDGAFQLDKNLTQIICHPELPPTCGKDVFSEVPVNTCILYVPAESIELYKNAKEWKEFQIIKPLDTAAIECIETIAPNSAKQLYNSQGIPSSVPASNRLYIHNGKKIILR